MKVRHLLIPNEAIQYDGTPVSVQSIRTLIESALGKDTVEVQYLLASRVPQVVQNVATLPYELHLRSVEADSRIKVDINKWVVSFLQRDGKPGPVLVFSNTAFINNFELDSQIR